MFNLSGEIYTLEITENNLLVIKKKSGKTISSQPVEKTKILHFNERNAFGVGQLVIFVEGMNTPLGESFGKDKVEDLKKMFEVLKEYCPYLQLTYTNALFYTLSKKKLEADTTIQKEKDAARLYQEPLKATSCLNENRSTQGKPSFISRMNGKKQKETECTCGNCNCKWYVNDAQIMRYVGNVLNSAGNLLSGSTTLGAYHLNNSNDIFQCPQCGSKKIKKKEVVFWVDKKGNYID
ncbi:MAG: hypothetical protein RSL74_09470 [Clostridium sp.]